MTAQELIDFEKNIANIFNQGSIKAPVHLYHGNEQQMIKIFEKINVVDDWVCTTWRNHYQCLLKGVSKELLEEKIRAGKSMVMCLSEYKILSSSIVGGIVSIATGIAASIKSQGLNNRVWCWSGDMSSLTGAWSEAYRYSVAHNLPITFIVEDNGTSVLTPTSDVWGNQRWYLPPDFDADWYEDQHLIYYRYKNTQYPHAGAGKRVQF